MYAYLGVSENKKIKLYVSSHKLNEIGTRCERGTNFPHIVYEFCQEKNADYEDVLIVLQKYFDDAEKKKSRK